MTKLHTILSRSDAQDVIAGQKRLSQVMPSLDEDDYDRGTLEWGIPVPDDSDSVTVEVLFKDGENFNRYCRAIMDGPTLFALPPEILDLGIVRVLSEAQMLDAARSMIRSCMLPSSDKMWEWMAEISEAERQKRGPYCVQAYEEFLKTDLPNATDEELLARLKDSAAYYGVTPAAFLLAAENSWKERCVIGSGSHWNYDEVEIDQKALAQWPEWVTELIPPGSKWQRCPWGDNSYTIRLVNPQGEVLAAKRV